jgi:hypothetical protein
MQYAMPWVRNRINFLPQILSFIFLHGVLVRFILAAIAFILACSFSSGAATLRPGQVLTHRATAHAGIDREIDMVCDSSERYCLQMKDDGILVLTDKTKKLNIWSTKTKSAGAAASMTGDGQLVVEDRTGTRLWSSGTKVAGSWLEVDKGGSLKIVSPYIAFQSSRSQPLSGHTDPVAWAGMIPVGKALRSFSSQNGAVDLFMQGDGILTIRKSGLPIFAFSNAPGDEFMVTEDGNLLVLLRGEIVYSLMSKSTSPTAPNYWQLRDDGNLVQVYGTTVWTTASPQSSGLVGSGLQPVVIPGERPGGAVLTDESRWPKEFNAYGEPIF